MSACREVTSKHDGPERDPAKRRYYPCFLTSLAKQLSSIGAGQGRFRVGLGQVQGRFSQNTWGARRRRTQRSDKLTKNMFDQSLVYFINNESISFVKGGSLSADQDKGRFFENCCDNGLLIVVWPCNAFMNKGVPLRWRQQIKDSIRLSHLDLNWVMVDLVSNIFPDRFTSVSSESNDG